MATAAELYAALKAADAAASRGDQQAAADARLIAQEIQRQGGKDASMGGQKSRPIPNNPLQNEPAIGRFMTGVGAEASDWARGLEQRVMRAGNKVGLVGDDAIADIGEEQQDTEKRDAVLDADPAARAGRLGMGLLAGGGVVTKTVKGAAALGATLGALAPTADEVTAIRNALVSGSFGAAGQVLGNKIAAWMAKGGKSEAALTPAELATLQSVVDRYKLRPGQVTGGKGALAAETQMRGLPLSGSDIDESIAGQRRMFNQDLYRTFGEAPVEGVPAGETKRIAKNFEGKYGAATNGVDLAVDSPMFQKMAATLQQYEHLLKPDQKAVIEQYITAIPQKFSGKDYQTWRARFGAAAESTSDPDFKAALKGLQGSLDDAFERQAPQANRDAMKQTRGEYRNFKTLQPLIETAEGQGENISPLNVARRAASEGNLGGEVAELGRVGRILGREGKSSGTSENQFYRGAMTGTMLGGGGAGAGFLAGGEDNRAGGAAAGGGLGLAAMLLGPKVGSTVYLSKALRDFAAKGAAKESERAFGNPQGLAEALRRMAAGIGRDDPELIESLVRGGLLPAAIPASALGE